MDANYIFLWHLTSEEKPLASSLVSVGSRELVACPERRIDPTGRQQVPVPGRVSSPVTLTFPVLTSVTFFFIILFILTLRLICLCFSFHLCSYLSAYTDLFPEIYQTIIIDKIDR